MKFKALSFIAVLAITNPAYAEIKAELVSAPIIKAGQAEEVKFNLTNSDNTPTKFSDMKIIHTRKIHALVVDPSLADYTHGHPDVAEKDGEYRFTFVPKFNSAYKVWLDVTPNNGSQQYIPLELKGSGAAGVVDKKVVTENVIDGVKFELMADKEIISGQMAMLTLKVTKDAKPFTNLQPVMGAFAHMVGFYEDYKTIAHLHPEGEEPSSKDAKGGPELMFHFQPAQKGFVKLFAQVQINEKDVYIPFAVIVK